MKTKNPASLLLSWMEEAIACDSEDKVITLLRKVGAELSFRDFGLFTLYVGHQELINVHTAYWECKDQSFQELLNSDCLLEFVPGFLNHVKPDYHKRGATLFRLRQYQSLLQKSAADDSEGIRFFRKYLRLYGGGFCLYRVNPVCYLVLFCGNGLKKNTDHQSILESLLPALSIGYENSPMGALKNLSPAQFSIMRVVEAGYQNRVLSKIYKLSISTIEKHKKTISLIAGLKHRYELCKKPVRSEPIWLDFDRGFAQKAPTRGFNKGKLVSKGSSEI